MNDNNQKIKLFLNNYLSINNPQYAVLLKGMWGCGKTFFIKKYLKEFEKPKADKTDDKTICWKPLYVSLYGISTIDEINKLLNKLIHPILNSKGVAVLTNILKGLARSTIKVDFDLCEKDSTLKTEQYSCNIDLLDVLDDNVNASIEGSKLLVFDDFERCKIDKRTLLGYINLFVEHKSCHVIIISAEENNEEMSKEILNIKEKTIGQEFKIEPETSNAIESIIGDMTNNKSNVTQVLTKNKDIIISLFNLSQKPNLRILRQSLIDFCYCISNITIPNTSNSKENQRYDEATKNLLICFIIFYLEYKTGQTKIADNNYLINFLYSPFSLSQREIQEIQEDNCLCKYEKHINIMFGSFLIKCFEELQNYFETGFFNNEFISDYISTEPDSITILLNAYFISDTEYQSHKNKVLNDFENNKYPDIYKTTDAILSLLIVKKNFNDNSIDKEKLNALFCTFLSNEANSISDLNDFHITKDRLINKINRFNESLDDTDFQSIQNSISTNFINKKLKDPLQELLNNISNDNINTICNNILYKTNPINDIPYMYCDIFEEIDTKKFVDKFRKLEPDSRYSLINCIQTLSDSLPNTSQDSISQKALSNIQNNTSKPKEIASLLTKSAMDISNQSNYISNKHCNDLATMLTKYQNSLANLKNNHKKA